MWCGISAGISIEISASPPTTPVHAPGCLVDHFAVRRFLDRYRHSCPRREQAADDFARPLAVAVEEVFADHVAVPCEGRARLVVHVEDRAPGVAYRNRAVHAVGPGVGIFCRHIAVGLSSGKASLFNGRFGVIMGIVAKIRR